MNRNTSPNPVRSCRVPSQFLTALVALAVTGRSQQFPEYDV